MKRSQTECSAPIVTEAGGTVPMHWPVELTELILALLAPTEIRSLNDVDRLDSLSLVSRQYNHAVNRVWKLRCDYISPRVAQLMPREHRLAYANVRRIGGIDLRHPWSRCFASVYCQGCRPLKSFLWVDWLASALWYNADVVIHRRVLFPKLARHYEMHSVYLDGEPQALGDVLLSPHHSLIVEEYATYSEALIYTGTRAKEWVIHRVEQDAGTYRYTPLRLSSPVWRDYTLGDVLIRMPSHCVETSVEEEARVANVSRVDSS